MPTRNVPTISAAIRPRRDVLAGPAGCLGAPPRPRLDPRPDDHQDQRDHQQHRHDLLEHRLRQVQQQPGADDRADERRRDLPAQPVPWPRSSRRYPQVPDTPPATRPTAFDIVAVTGG